MELTEQIGLSDQAAVLAIIADDLTGALDAAAPFADRGLAVRVATRPDALADIPPGTQVVAVSTRSREVAPDVALARVRRALAGLSGAPRLFKKVDSRLKGNIAVELSAFAPGPVLAVPALPEFARVVRGGMVQGWGVDAPIAVAPILGRPSHVPDVATADDMAAALAAAPDHLIVGARGAAVALAAAMAGRPAVVPAVDLPMVIVVGSTDPITLAQVAALRAGLPGLRHVSAPDGRALAPPISGVTLLQAVAGAARADGAAVAAALAQSLLSLLPAGGTLVLTGGATAEAVLDAMAISVLDLRGDRLPGLPLSVAGPWRIVTKSGGFGDAGTLLELARGAGA